MHQPRHVRKAGEADVTTFETSDVIRAAALAAPRSYEVMEFPRPRAVLIALSDERN
jgi:hypothetical protein